MYICTYMCIFLIYIYKVYSRVISILTKFTIVFFASEIITQITALEKLEIWELPFSACCPCRGNGLVCNWFPIHPLADVTCFVFRAWTIHGGKKGWEDIRCSEEAN